MDFRSWIYLTPTKKQKDAQIKGDYFKFIYRRYIKRDESCTSDMTKQVGWHLWWETCIWDWINKQTKKAASVWFIRSRSDVRQPSYWAFEINPSHASVQ